MARVELHPEAAAEATAAYEWYAEHSASAADRFLAELDLAVEKIAATPMRWPIYLNRTRRYLLQRFPYIVVFRQSEEDLIEIVAIAHGRRRPGYWKSR
jgi:toxin ParE1/3/4